MRKNYFRRSLILVLLITSLPTAAIAVGSYFIGVKQIQTEVYHKNEYQLEQTFQRLDDQFTQLEFIVDKWAVNPLFSEQLRYAEWKNDIAAVHDIYSSLSVLQSTNPMISSVDLFLNNQQLLLSTGKGTIRFDNEPERQGKYASLLEHRDLIYWSEFSESIPRDKSVLPLMLVHKLPVLSTRPYGAILVYLDIKQINKELKQLNPYKEGVSFIITPEGDWIASSEKSSPEGGELQELIKSRIVPKAEGSASFTMKWRDVDYSVAYATFKKTGWRYVLATPLSQLTAPISITSKLMLAVSAAGIIASVLLSWFASHRIYRPIKRLVHMFSDSFGKPAGLEDTTDEIEFIERKWLNVNRESQTIQSLLEENKAHMHRSFLLQLVQGHLYFFSESEIRERLEEYGWDTEDKKFVLLLVQLSPYPVIGKRFMEGDEQLVTFAAANIIEELSAERPDREVINFHNLSVSILIPVSQGKPDEQVRSELYKFANELIDTITKLLGVHVAVGVSTIVPEVRRLPEALEEVRQCLHFGNIELQGQILSADEMLPHFKETSDYPFELEKEIIQSLRLGLAEEAMQKTDAFITEIKCSTGQIFQIQQYMTQLLSRMMNTMMEFGVVHESFHQGINLYEQLFRLTKTDEISAWFKTNVIQPFMKTLSEKQGLETARTIRMVMELIEQEYSNDISLEYLSDKAGLLPKRLSAVFAQVTGKNFIDYVTEIRLEKSKELLRTTDLKVNDIAVRVGYQPSYFNKTFKKYVGMTPGEYRERDQA